MGPPRREASAQARRPRHRDAPPGGRRSPGAAEKSKRGIALLPTGGHGGRYQPLVVWLFVPLVVLGAGRLCRVAIGPKHAACVRQGLLGAAALAALAPLLVRSLMDWASAHAYAVQHVNWTEVEMGRWLARLPTSARIASFDVGGTAYYSGRPLLDLGGLADPSVVSHVRGARLRQLLERERIDYVVVPLGYAELFPDPWNFELRLGLLGDARPRWVQAFALSSPLHVWEPGLRATLHCAPRQVAFRLAREGGG